MKKPGKRYYIDSRSVIDPADAIFIPLVTNDGDGHDYVRELYKAGVREFLFSRKLGAVLKKDCKDAIFHKVDDTFRALIEKAIERRVVIKDPIVAITGSRGKTIVKEWIDILLKGKTVRSPRSYNSHIGVPLALVNMNYVPGNPVLMEVGISQKGDMLLQQALLRPDIVVLTNVTDEHDEGFSDYEEHIFEKVSLAKQSSVLVLNKNATDIIEVVNRSLLPVNPFLNILLCDLKEETFEVEVNYMGYKKSYTYEIDDLTRSQLNDIIKTPEDKENLTLALGATFSLDASKVKQALRMIGSLHPIHARLTVLEGINNRVLVVDNFRADTLSLMQPLDYCRRIAKGDGMSFILYNNLPEGMKLKYKDLLEIGELALKYGFQRTYVIDPEPPRLWGKLMEKNIVCFRNINSVADEILNSRKPDKVLLFHSPYWDNGFKELIGHFQVHMNETTLEVNLDSLIHNYRFFRHHLYRDTGIICMLKAFGYGTGSVEIARCLEQQGVSMLAVAVTDEGVELREKGIRCPIMILNPRSLNHNILLSHNLEPVIYNFEMLDVFDKMIKIEGEGKIKVHIKLETGMRRLGFLSSEIDELSRRLNRLEPYIEVSTVFSHLATADCPDMDDYTLSQIRDFVTMADRLESLLGYHIKRHILNSAGILRFPEAQMDMVRLGIGLYGIKTLPDPIEEELRPIATLVTKIISLKLWSKGESVGYGRKGKLQRNSVIATLPVGYADGIDRRMGNGRVHFLVNGKKCPTVGNICMDLCMIDVTDVEDCTIGTRVEIFGESLPINEHAFALDTIPYEIIASVSKRVNRVYYRD